MTMAAWMSLAGVAMGTAGADVADADADAGKDDEDDVTDDVILKVDGRDRTNTGRFVNDLMVRSDSATR